MSLRSKLQTENIGMFAALAFYAIAGIVCLAVLPMANFPLHIGIMGILSLLTAFGLFKKRTWTIWVISVVFLVATTYSAYTLYYYLGRDLLLDVSTSAYLILTWVFTAYVVAKRKTLQS
jgi:uncharacterized membrane protein YecN with MAPEG domain